MATTTILKKERRVLLKLRAIINCQDDSAYNKGSLNNKIERRHFIRENYTK
jgi:hypothetical protein